MKLQAIPLSGIKGAIAVYFNWAANTLVPFFPGGADVYLRQHKETILSVASQFLSILEYEPTVLYRGIILRQPIVSLSPKEGVEYLSFSTNLEIARHFADVNGFGSDIVDVRQQLGDYGYVIEYCPDISEILFHHDLLDILPFEAAYNLTGIDGRGEVEALKRQQEVVVLQPPTPILSITPQFSMHQEDLYH